MPRWITVREPFDYTWPSRAITAFVPGEEMVKDEVADYAVGKGYATEGKVDASARSSKVRRPRRTKEPAPAKAADHGSADSVDSADHDDDDRPAGLGAVDEPAGER